MLNRNKMLINSDEGELMDRYSETVGEDTRLLVEGCLARRNMLREWMDYGMVSLTGEWGDLTINVGVNLNNSFMGGYRSLYTIKHFSNLTMNLTVDEMHTILLRDSMDDRVAYPEWGDIQFGIWVTNAFARCDPRDPKVGMGKVSNVLRNIWLRCGDVSLLQGTGAMMDRKLSDPNAGTWTATDHELRVWWECRWVKDGRPSGSNPTPAQLRAEWDELKL